MQEDGTVALAGSFSVDAIAIPELGNTTYLITSGTRPWSSTPHVPSIRFIEAAAARGSTITYVLDTHVHNDFISGACELRERTGARLVAPRRGRYEFPHFAVEEATRSRLATRGSP